MTTAIIQARLGSTRLPGKVLKNLNGKPLIEQIINRLKYCKNIDAIVLATTTSNVDDKLANWCEENNISYFRGDENNVLKRYYDAATKYKSNVIVRVTADDPFKDPNIIDSVIEVLLNNKLDFAYNNNPPSFPEGLDTEVFTYKAIKKATEANTTDFEKEHVTQYFYNNLQIFKCSNFSYKENISHIRLTVDTEQDFHLAEMIYSKLSPKGEMFYLDDILSLFKAEPDLLEINKGVKRSALYAK
ncbi:MAG: glycosyltransferase family protein [Treponema sp.]|nr:glycosyltransferase family protein [Treponema sp.]